MSTTTVDLAESSGTATFDVHAPATGEWLATVDDMGPDRVATLVDHARTAQPDWEALGADGRGAVLERFRRHLVRRREEVIDLVQREGGKPYEDAQADLLITLTWLKHWIARGGDLLADQRIRSASPFALARTNLLVRSARGVVGVIAPWNVPVALGLGDALPALMAGNSVVVKPSEVTPLSTLLVRRLWVESGGPEDVLQVATGAGGTGSALVDQVDYVHFTGSVATGQRVATRAIQRMIPYSLELGGKDAMVVLADADLERAANGCVQHALFNSGQVCMSVERVFVESDVHDAFVDLVAEKVRALRQGAPGGVATVDVGAMIHPPQRDLVAAHVADAVRDGARVVVGGQAHGHQYFAPTVLTDVTPDMTCMRDETFGPTIPIMRVADADEAVRLANDTEFGLTASVWTRDRDRGEQVARQLEAGTVTVNDAMVHLGAAELPMGGWKSSGVGARNGDTGLTRFTRAKVIQVPRLTPATELAWLPYTSLRSRLLGAAAHLSAPSPLRRVTSLVGRLLPGAGNRAGAR